MWASDKNHTARGFSTPPASWHSRPTECVAMPISERKRVSPVPVPANGGDLFHIIHKVPSGDSPYVRAKHVQLIEKDPSRAISLFWSAINAGDRVDSALKDMAVVMKQLDRSDEAVEAIKSFRHLCPFESQESLDNVLIELYKRSGRVEEEIRLLQCKLMSIDEGLAFGGKKTKVARSQGKKTLITIEQEKSRILGNLAWAYLQQHNYGIAEQHYRRALTLEPDMNKQCNLAICLMHMKRNAEAKSLLQSVKDFSGNREMDESYAKSYERAMEMLTEMEELHHKQNGKSSIEESSSSDSSMLFGGKVCSDEWSRSCRPETPSATRCSNRMNRNHHFPMSQPADRSPDRKKPAAAYHTAASPASFKRNSGVLLTQPKRSSSWGLNNGEEGRWGENRVGGGAGAGGGGSGSGGAARKLSFEQPPSSTQNLNGELATTTSYNENNEKSTKRNPKLNEDGLMSNGKKSWADIVEEEEKEKQQNVYPFTDEEDFSNENLDTNKMYHHHQHQSQESSSYLLESQMATLSQELCESLDLKDGYGSSSSDNNAMSLKNTSGARRSLCFEGYHQNQLKAAEAARKNVNVNVNAKRRNNRLQVFRDITPSPDLQDSP